VFTTVGLARAKALVITFANTAVQLQVIEAARAHNPSIPIVVRTYDDTDGSALKAAGASDVVPELAEGSLMLASHALLRLGIPMRTVLAQVQTARGNGYQGLGAYFHGADDSEDHHAHLHTVVLTAQAWAVGQSVANCRLRLSKLGAQSVRVNAVRGVFGDALAEEEYCEADTAWVLEGSAANVSQAEAVLLGG
jgi:CPA2 family monovalent cation:H+ antiporter-2